MSIHAGMDELILLNLCMQNLTCTGQLSYLGTSWRKDVSFAGYGVALQGDITAGRLDRSIANADIPG